MLYGENIRLRALEREHLPNYVRWFNDPEVRQYLAWNRPMSSMEEDRWFEDTLGTSSDFRFAIEVPAGETGDWQHIGSIGLENID